MSIIYNSGPGGKISKFFILILEVYAGYLSDSFRSKVQA